MSGGSNPAPEGYIHRKPDGSVYQKVQGQWVQLQGPAQPPSGSEVTGMAGDAPVYQSAKRDAVPFPAVALAQDRMRIGQVEGTIDALNQAWILAKDPEVVAALGTMGGKPYAEAVRTIDASTRVKIDALRQIAFNGVLERAKELRPASNSDIALLTQMFGADGSLDAVNVQTGMGRLLRGMADEGAMLGSRQAFGQMYGDPNAMIQTPEGYISAAAERPYAAAREYMDRVLPGELRTRGARPQQPQSADLAPQRGSTPVQRQVPVRPGAEPAIGRGRGVGGQRVTDGIDRQFRAEVMADLMRRGFSAPEAEQRFVQSLRTPEVQAFQGQYRVAKRGGQTVQRGGQAVQRGGGDVPVRSMTDQELRKLAGQ